MTLTLLLDLDDTLLENSMETFVPAYLQALGKYLSPVIPPENLVPALLAGTESMLENNSPDRTLKDAFDQVFYPRLEIDAEQYVEQFNSFYSTAFPNLKQITRTRPGAVRLIKEAFNQGYRVAIATNPLFPRMAIVQRLEWADLPPEKYPFELIPSYEFFHFAKPNPAFFTELLGRLGWPTGPVIMVGDDFDHDIAPARQLGIGNYWVSSDEKEPGSDLPITAGHGSIDELISWIDSVTDEDMQLDTSHIDTMLTVLRSTPAVVRGFAKHLESTRWSEHPQPGEWNFTEILCHLRDVDAEVNIPRINRVISEENPFLPGIDTDEWAQQRLYYCQNGPLALKDFTRARMQLLDVLDSLAAQDWDRPARHAIFGPTRLKELVRIIVGHDQLHIQQAYGIVGEITKHTVTG
jgi:FMN phosphatase YigB (HAD superfamily)